VGWIWDREDVVSLHAFCVANVGFAPLVTVTRRGRRSSAPRFGMNATILALGDATAPY